MAEAAQTQPGPWPSWRAILWAPALPGVPLWLGLSVHDAFFVWTAKANLAPFVFLAYTAVLGYGVTLLCGLLHWPIWRLRWHGPEAFATLGAVIAGLAFVEAEWNYLSMRFAPFFVLTAINYWWITFRGIGLVHRIANGLWIFSPVVAYGAMVAIDAVVFN